MFLIFLNYNPLVVTNRIVYKGEFILKNKVIKMKTKIAVEGLEKDIVPFICKILEMEDYNICYRHESPFQKDSVAIIDDIIESGPDITIVCNAEYYSSFLKTYSERTDIPLIVLTGGGPELEEKVKEYTPHVLSVPFPSIENLYEKINEIIG